MSAVAVAPLLIAPLVFAPLLLAVVAWLVPDRIRPVLTLAGLVAVAVPAVCLAVVVATHGTVEQALGGWDPPLGIVVRVDGLSMVFVLLTLVVSGLVAAHAAALDDHPPAFWPLTLLLVAGLHAVFITGDLFNAYVGLEVVGLAAVGLVALGGRGAWEPALRYLLVAVLGSLLFLVALGLVYAGTGSLDMHLAGQRWADSGIPAVWPLGIAAVGLALKCALFPLHGWLPPAHASAPTGVSPLLSGLVVKAPLFVLLRLWFDVTGPDPTVGLMLGVLGAGAVLWGGGQALVQRGLKRVVAYSTVAQVGYLFLFFPLALDPDARELALSGMVVLAVAHALAKAALFLCAGTLKQLRGSDELTTLPGLAHGHPALLLAMGLSAVSLIGLPISAGFIGKWQLLSAASGAGAHWIVIVLVGGTLLSAGYLLRPIAAGMEEPDEHVAWPPLGWRHLLAPITLALISTVLGLRAVELVTLVGVR
ncbi:MAG: proton-conducting transporter membrane subunit [Propionibacteriaceae bacterium]|nr:proton-conducting transporter membrane subunit [Propionibacteriaceae bacterium]